MIPQPAGPKSLGLELNAARDAACSGCNLWLNVRDADLGLDTGHISISKIPTALDLKSRVTPNGLGKFHWTSAAPGADLRVGSSLGTFDILGLPTKVTADATGSPEDLNVHIDLTTAGSQCDDIPRECAISSANLVFNDVQLPFTFEESFGPLPFDAWPGATVTGTVEARLDYEYTSHLELLNVTYFKESLTPVSEELPVPMLVREAGPQWGDGGAVASTQEYFRDVKLCPGCNDLPATHNKIDYSATIVLPIVCPIITDPWPHYVAANSETNECVVTKVEDPEPTVFTRPTTGVIGFWGWEEDLFLPALDNNHKYRFGGNFAASSEINQRTSEWLGNPPFTPQYSHATNELQGPWPYNKRLVHIINPQDIVLRPPDREEKCLTYNLGAWTTNCYWQLVLDLVPAHPAGF